MCRIEGIVYCDSCGVEILWAPVVVGNHDYCCRDCLDGLPCECGDRMEMDDERRSSAPDMMGMLSGDAL